MSLMAAKGLSQSCRSVSGIEDKILKTPGRENKNERWNSKIIPTEGAAWLNNSTWLLQMHFNGYKMIKNIIFIAILNRVVVP